VSERLLLQARGLTKSYPGVRALSDVSVGLHPGEVHVVLGENGAGKSTLIKILSGAIQPDSGHVALDGKSVRFTDPLQARKTGIATIYQEGSLIDTMTVSENLFLGNELRASPHGLVASRQMHEKTRQILDEIGLSLQPSLRVKDLSLNERQLVEISRSLLTSLRLLILDEPTSALTEREAARLFSVIDQLCASGVGVVYVTHKLAEVTRIADHVTVLRDGRRVNTVRADEVKTSDLIRMMIGREMTQAFPDTARSIAVQDLLRVRALRGKAFRDVDLTVNSGEIVGLAGLLGAGQSEVLRAICGAEPVESGTVELGGKQVAFKSPSQAVLAGVGYIPADRKGQGIVPSLSVRSNLVLAALRRLSRWGIMRKRAELSLYSQLVDQLRIKAAHPEVPIRNLSGGNQQKVVLGRAVGAGARLLLFDEPTRGVDVGAKFQIYELLHSLVDRGTGVLMFSSDLLELLGLCDRLYVMHAGTIAGVLAKDEATEESVTELAFGQTGD